MMNYKFRNRMGLLFILPVIFLFTACPDDNEPPNKNTSINLTVVNTWTVSVKLQISVEDTTDSWTFELARNDCTVLIANVIGSDTTVTDVGLTPGTEYIYKAFWLDNSEQVDSSQVVVIQTMDTTSHNFVWEIDTLGDYGSYLNDVAIIDENNVWVVGAIETDSGWFNLSKWDGRHWTLEMVGPVGNNLYSIFIFSENDIWVANYCSPYHWDGNDWTFYHMPTLGIDACAGNAIWGSSPDDIYFVGVEGSIVHYDGLTFTKMESGTGINLVDVYGTSDERYLFIVGYNYSGESIAIQLFDGFLSILYEGVNLYSEPYGRMKSVYVVEDLTLLGCSEGIWYYYFLKNESELFTKSDISWENSIYQVISNRKNDIVLISNWGKVYHYNGNTWNTDNNLSSIIENDGSFLTGKVKINRDLIVIVGKSNEWRALIAQGKRS